MAGMTKADMVNAAFWDRLWRYYGDQCGGIRSLRFGGGLEIVFDPPITRDSFAVPGDFPSRRSDEGDVYVFGVYFADSERPVASGEATAAPQTPPEPYEMPLPPPEPETGALFGKGRQRKETTLDEFRYTRKPGKESPFGDAIGPEDFPGTDDPRVKPGDW